MSPRQMLLGEIFQTSFQASQVSLDWSVQLYSFYQEKVQTSPAVREISDSTSYAVLEVIVRSFLFWYFENSILRNEIFH